MDHKDYLQVAFGQPIASKRERLGVPANFNEIGVIAHRLESMGGAAAVFANRAGKLMEASRLTSAVCCYKSDQQEKRYSIHEYILWPLTRRL